MVCAHLRTRGHSVAPKNSLPVPAAGERLTQHPGTPPKGIRRDIPEASAEEVEYALAAIGAPFDGIDDSPGAEDMAPFFAGAASAREDAAPTSADASPIPADAARISAGATPVYTLPVRRRIFSVFFIVAVVLACGSASAQLPDMPQRLTGAMAIPMHAPVKPGLLTRTEFALVVMDAGARAMDWVSTEECQRRPWSCHEAELPTALVRNKAGFAALEGSEVAAEALLAHLLHKRHHDRLAELGQSVEIGCVTATVLHNYSIPAVFRPRELR